MIATIRIFLKTNANPFSGKSKFTFELESGSTKVNLSTRVNAFDLFQINEGILEKKLKKQLKEIAEQGYAIDNEELDIGVRCVSAPIRDYTRRIIGAVSISGPSMRFLDERVDKELIPLVMRAAEEISSKLGFQK